MLSIELKKVKEGKKAATTAASKSVFAIEVKLTKF